MSNTPQEFENNIQRFIQIREQIHEEIKKIGTHVGTLEETNKRLLAHVDVFKGLSEKAQKNMRHVIKESAHEMASVSAKELTQLTEGMLRHNLAKLDRSIQNAEEVLETTMSQKYRKLLFCALAGFVLVGFAGFGGGYYQAKRTTYEFPKDFLKMYARGLVAEEKTKHDIQRKIKVKNRK